MKALELARSTGQLPQMPPVAMPSPGAAPYPVSAAAAAAAAAAMQDPRLKVWKKAYVALLLCLTLSY